MLCRIFSDHLNSFGIMTRKANISELSRSEQGFKVDGGDFSHVILATGTSPNKLGIPGELHFIEDAIQFKGMDILIVGGGDLAFDNALTLHNGQANVTIVHRSNIKANNILQEEVKRAGIRIIKGNPKEIGLKDGYYVLENKRYQYLFAFIGRSPELGLLEGMENPKMYLPSFRTSVKGLYVIGDAALGTLSQTALASGSGLAAAMDIARMVKKDENALREGT